jgi:hypothetical protein
LVKSKHRSHCQLSKKQEFALTHSNAYPVELHVNDLGATLLDGVIRDAGSTRNVGLERGGGLQMSKVFKNDLNHYAILRIA